MELYGASNNNRDVKLASNMNPHELERDASQSMDPRMMRNQGIEGFLNTFFVPEEDFRGLPMSIGEALNLDTTLDAGNNNKMPPTSNANSRFNLPPGIQARMENRSNNKPAGVNKPSTSQPINQIKTTRAQLLRQQKNQQTASDVSVASASFGGGGGHLSKKKSFLAAPNGSSQ